MRSRETFRRWPSLAGAVVMSLLVAGQSLAATWSEPYAIAAPNPLGYVYGGTLVTLDEATVIALYARDHDDVARVVIRRSDDGGSSWQAPRLVSDHGWFPTLAGLGANVDVVWIWNGRVRYARSIDAGSTFAEPVALSPARGHASSPSVARGPLGLVAVTWQQGSTVKVRVSTDGGTSFGSSTTIATDRYSAQIAVGDGVVHVVSANASLDGMRVDRSLDGGATWSTTADWAIEVGQFEGAEYDVAAAGNRAFVAYETRTAARYRLTSDRGATWSRSLALLDRGWRGNYPHVSLDGDAFRVVFNGSVLGEIKPGVFYRQSVDGRTWTAPQRVSPRGFDEAYARAVGFAGKTIVMFNGFPTERDPKYIYVRTASQ